MSWLIFPLLALAACISDTEALRYYDRDSDGFPVAEAAAVGYSGPTDCDDTDATVHPDATEVCDGVDNDCNDMVDDGDDRITLYLDADGDDFGVSTSADQLACGGQDGWADRSGDCDDEDVDTWPGAPELCDGLDNDCNQAIDDLDTFPTWYADTDGDGFGDDEQTAASCDSPTGYVARGGDCDDGDELVNPDATEVCSGIDEDCDGLIDADDPSMDGFATWYRDADEDGHGDPSDTQEACEAPTGYVRTGKDCDDADPVRHPDAPEVCDGVDNDCDTLVDDDDPLLTGAATWYADADADLYGDPDAARDACAQPDGHVDNAEDCDDGEAETNPSAPELCGGADEDCDGEVDEPDAADAPNWYLDADGDGFGTALGTVDACAAPEGYAATDDDCDDTTSAAAATFPGAAASDSSVDCTKDADGDGWGDRSPAAFGVIPGTDCDDTRSAVHPGATEVCNGLDDDCGGDVDEADSADALTWYVDADGDGHGAASGTLQACTQPTGYAGTATDCDDTGPSTFPGAAERESTSSCRKDADDDGYGDVAPPTGVTAGTDCDDTIGTVYVGAAETCNDRDDDCDAAVDDAAVDVTTWYADSDSDGHGDPAVTIAACSAPTDYIAVAGDCDDADATRHPGAAEICDGMDKDCDGYDAHDVPGRHATIQDGISAAKAGESVCVASGTYNERILFSRDIELAGAGADLTFIDGGAGGTTLVSNASGVIATVRDLTLQNGASAQGGGIATAGGSLSLQDVRIRANTCGTGSCQGAGVFAYSADVTMERVEVSGNTCTPTGSGVPCQGSALYLYDGVFTMNDSSVFENVCSGSVSWCLGSVVIDAGEAFVDKSTIRDNLLETALARGAGLYVRASAVDITNSQILENVASGDSTQGGALFATDASTIELHCTILAANESRGGSPLGGGVFSKSSTIMLTNAAILENLSYGTSGSAVGGGLFSTGSTVEIEGTVFASNEAVSSEAPTGSAIYSTTDTYTIGYSDFFDHAEVVFEGLASPVGTSGNLSVDPMFLDISGTPDTWDLRLGTGSLLIDAGDPAILDPDGSRGDIGPYGGPCAAGW